MGYSLIVADGTVGLLCVETSRPFKNEIISQLPKETHVEYIPKKCERRGERGFETELVRDLEKENGYFFNFCQVSFLFTLLSFCIVLISCSNNL